MDMIDPVQSMDIQELGRRFGGQICFAGGIDTQHLLRYASPKEVKIHVRSIIYALGTFNGGYFGLLINIFPNNPIENIQAALEALVEFGQYPLKLIK